jgi:hypothetical protein
VLTDLAVDPDSREDLCRRTSLPIGTPFVGLGRVSINQERERRVTEEEATLALLQTELNGIQGALRGLDQIIFQIKGWCVTASLAIGGVAIAYHRPGLLIVGFGAVIGFYLINCQFSAIQRSFIERNFDLDVELRSVGILQVLKGAGNF